MESEIRPAQFDIGPKPDVALLCVKVRINLFSTFPKKYFSHISGRKSGSLTQVSNKNFASRIDRIQSTVGQVAAIGVTNRNVNLYHLKHLKRVYGLRRLAEQSRPVASPVALKPETTFFSEEWLVRREVS